MVHWEAYHRIWPIGPEFWNMLAGNIAFHSRHSQGYKPPASIANCMLSFNSRPMHSGAAFYNAWAAFIKAGLQGK